MRVFGLLRAVVRSQALGQMVALTSSGVPWFESGLRSQHEILFNPPLSRTGETALHEKDFCFTVAVEPSTLEGGKPNIPSSCSRMLLAEDGVMLAEDEMMLAAWSLPASPGPPLSDHESACSIRSSSRRGDRGMRNTISRAVSSSARASLTSRNPNNVIPEFNKIPTGSKAGLASTL